MSVSSLGFGRFVRLALRAQEVWQGGIVRMPTWVQNPTDKNGPPFRPLGALWVSLRTGLIHLEFPEKEAPATEAPDDFALRALVNFGLKEAKRLEGRPALVQVRDANLQHLLSEALSRFGTRVELVDDLPPVRHVLQEMEAGVSEGPRVPNALEAAGVTIERMRAYADAAAAFFRAAPWQYLANADLLVVEAPLARRGMKHIVVLGNAGEQFGIGFFGSRKAFERMFDDRPKAPPTHVHGVTFGAIDEMTCGDADLWEDHGLPLAGPRAYPFAVDLHLEKESRRPGAADLAYIEALLRTLAATTEDELDAGRWEKTVPTFDGAVTVRLTLPLLLEGEAGPSPLPPGRPLARLVERSTVTASRFLGSRSFESLEDANKALDDAQAQGLFDRPPEQALGRALTPLEEAQDLAYAAMEATGRLRVKWARLALTRSPDCADACIILGESMATPERALEWYERGVEAGARAIGADRFAKLAGEFWSHLETRPYMRARLAVAQAVDELGRRDEAVAQYRDMLRLNPDDNQGVRELLLPMLFEERRDADAAALLDQYRDDIHAVWSYGEALRWFRTDGDGPRSRAALAAAARANPYVTSYLLLRDLDLPLAPRYTLGSVEEALYVASALHASYWMTPGAVDWLRPHSRRPPRAARRTPRAKSGRGR